MSKDFNAWKVKHNTGLKQILNWCHKSYQIDRMLLTTPFRSEQKDTLSYPKVLPNVDRLFSEFIVRKKQLSKWPCMHLHGYKANVYFIQYNDTVRKRMLETQDILKEWVGSGTPPLPEDICLYRRGAEYPTFVSVTHHNDGWIIADKRPNCTFIDKTVDPIERKWIKKYSVYFK